VLRFGHESSAALLVTGAHGHSGWVNRAESDWSAEDWQAFFDERAGVAEYDGGLPRQCHSKKWSSMHLPNLD